MRRTLLLLPWLVSSLAAQNRPAADSTRPVTLAEAIARGRSAGVQATLAHLTLGIAQARSAERDADRLPSVIGSASAVRQTANLDEFGLAFATGVTDPFSVFRAKVGVNQVVFDKSLFDQLRIAKDSLSAIGLDATRSGEVSAALAGAAWLRLVAAVETVRARANDSVTAYALRDIAAAQVDAGTAARIERTRSESQISIVRGQLSLARIAVTRAQLDLARALDLPATPRLVPAGDPALVYDAPPANEEAAVTLALANRPDLAALQTRATLAEAALKSIHDEWLPSVGAQGYAQSSGTHLDKMSNSWMLAIGLNWTAFDGHRRQQRENEQQLKIDAQRARVHDLQQQITTDARQAVLELSGANEQLSLAGERVQLAQQEMDEAQERLTAGVTGTQETTRAQGALSSARDNLIQARVSVGAAQLSAAATFGLLQRIH